MFRILHTGGFGGGAKSYEVALRAIGQDLAALFIESLKITVEGEILVAQGHCVSSADEPEPEGSERFLRRARQRLASLVGARGRKKSSRDRFVRRYTAEDINRLDEMGAARKTGVQKIPDASSLAESLRTAGRVVDSKRGRLVMLSKDRTNIKFVYEDKNGQTHTEEHYSLSIYQNQQQALSLRGTKKKEDVWEDSR